MCIRDSFSTEEPQDPDTGDGLGEYRCQSGTPDTHSESKNKDRIQNDVADSTDQNGNHGNGGKSLGSDKGIHTERELYK